MAEMYVETPLVKHSVSDYDIIFDSGMILPITIDLSAGDTISFSDQAILIHLAPKPSVNDPDKLLPSKDITIFTPHIVSIEHSQREVTELTPEEKFNSTRLWKELLGKTVQ